jgi:hypothetical protein
LHCKIKNCEQAAGGDREFCFECASFPCARLRRLDARYRATYGMSMLENLDRIREFGLDAFVASEHVRWTCPECGALLCVHRRECVSCGYSWNPAKAGRGSSHGALTEAAEGLRWHNAIRDHVDGGTDVPGEHRR